MLGAVLLLAGCAGVAPPALEQPLPPAWRGADAAAATLPAPDLRHWWQWLGDPLLDPLVDELLKQNLGLAQARLRLRQARLAAARDNSAYRPQVSAGLHTVQEADAVDTFYRSSLEVNWELSLYGERQATDRIAQARIEQALAQGQAAQVAVVAELVRQVLLWRAAQQDTAALQRQLALDTRLLERARQRRQLQVGSRAELQAAEDRLAETQGLAAAPPHAAAAAAAAIAALLGRTAPDPSWAATPAPLPPAGRLVPAEVPADLLRTRADLRAAEAAVQQAAGEAGLARAELYPRVALGVSTVSSYNITKNRRIVNASVIGIGPLIDIPLFDWGRRRANADAHELALEAAALAWRQTLLDAVAETESALSALAAAGDRVALQSAAAERARLAATRQAALVRAGLALGDDSLLAERRTLEAEQAAAAARFAAAQATVQLYKALGGAPLFDAGTVAAGAAP